MVCLCDWLPLSVPSVVLCVCVGWCAAVPAVSLWDGLPVVVCLWLLIGGLWSVTSTPCQPVSLCRGLCVDGLPVVAGMCCLWWSVPSVVLCVGWMVCHSSSGEGVGW